VHTLWKRITIPAAILLCGSVVVAQQTPNRPVKTGKSASTLQDDTRLQTLLTQRLELLRQMETIYRAQYRAGQATLNDVEQAAIAVYRTDLERKHTHAEQMGLTQQWVKAAQDIRKMADERVKTGMATQVEAIKAQAALVEAEIALERMKNGS